MFPQVGEPPPCIVIFPDPNKDSLLIVFMLVPLTKASCLPSQEEIFEDVILLAALAVNTGSVSVCVFADNVIAPLLYELDNPVPATTFEKAFLTITVHFPALVNLYTNT